MKQKSSPLFVLLILLLTRPQISARSTPKPFDTEQPSLRVSLLAPELATGCAVVACPDGGYSGLTVNHKGYDWAPYFNKQGIALIVLKYRIPRGDRILPIFDTGAAMKMVRDSVDVWNLNPNDIDIIGSPAGDYLALTIVAHAPEALHPNFQILFYPAIAMNKSSTYMGSRDNLLGKNASADLEKEFSNKGQMTKETPRAFIVYSGDDKVVPPVNGVNYYLTLNKKGVPSVLHIYPTGGHDWGIREDFLYKSKMQNEPTSWLRSFKVPRKDAVRVVYIDNSIMFGAGIRNRSRDGYPSVLARMLGDSYWVKDLGVSARTILNKGDHPYMNKPAYKSALAPNLNITVIELGADDNESFSRKYKAGFMKDAQTIIDVFKGPPSQPKIRLCYPSKVYLTGGGISDDIISKGIIPMIKRLAKKNGLSVINLHTAMDGMPKLFPDHTHPDEEGAQAVIKAVYQSISTLK